MFDTCTFRFYVYEKSADQRCDVETEVHKDKK